LEIQSAIPKDYQRRNEINCSSEDWNTTQLKERSMSLSRRAFIENSAILIAAIGVSDAAWSASAPMLSESDPTAQALGYKADASTVDKSKFAQYAPGQSCSSCALYQGAAGSSSGPCALFAGKAVSAKGWCASYAKKG
jgi:hypothetical protein